MMYPQSISSTCTHHIRVQFRSEIEGKEGKPFTEFVAVRYSTQVVAGINYYIKVCGT